MSSRHPILLTLMLVAATCWGQTHPSQPSPPIPPPRAIEPPLPGVNSISNLVVEEIETGVWQARFDYFYTGEPVGAMVSVTAQLPGVVPRPFGMAQPKFAQRGTQHVAVNLPYPGSQQITRTVIATLRDMRKPVNDAAASIAVARIDRLIEWPTLDTWMRNSEFASHSPQENLDIAISKIDSNGSTELSAAKSILERLIAKDPMLEQGYVELARVAMKSNWGPEGLHQAEGLLSSALQIKPDSANAKILMGYVYANQKRFAEAEKLFVDAAKSNPRNLWLWTNWGQLLAMQGKFDEATAKYRQAVDRPMTHDTYDRARAEAYRNLFTLLERKKNFDAMEALYKQRISDFGNGSCYSADYAKFLLYQRDNTTGAIDVSRKALNANCDDAPARQMLGLANYVLWSRSTGKERDAALNQARIYLPPSPKLLFLLARSDSTVQTAAQLVASGESLEQKDNQNSTALAQAVEEGDIEAAKRLLRLGAKADTPVGYAEMPVALVPIVTGNVEMIRAFQEAGTDYAKIRYQGVTAFEYAKQSSDTQLQDVLNRKPRSL